MSSDHLTQRLVVDGGGDAARFKTSEGNSYTMDIGFEELGLKLNNRAGTLVLQSVTGSIDHGRLTAVMGPSGSGKTTFITTLAGRAHYGTQQGRVTINGKRESVAQLRKFVGFVPQEDTMVRCLTVREVLAHEAALRLDRGVGQDEREAIINETLEVLGLVEVQNSIIGDELIRGVSGGQRKRVNIGMELVAKPTLLFLDEPTSGLDSTASAEVVKALARVTHGKGITVAAVIHQPRYEIFTLFDDILLLGKGGRTAYLGPTDDALAYFAKLGYVCPKFTSPPDFFLDTIVEHAREVHEKWNDRCDAEGKLPPKGAEADGFVQVDGALAASDLSLEQMASANGLWVNMLAAENGQGVLRAILFGLISGPCIMSGCIMANHWVRRGSMNRLEAHAFCAGAIIGAMALCVVFPVLSVVSWVQDPLDATTDQPSSMQQIWAGYLFVIPVVGGLYVALWIILFVLGGFFLKRLLHRYRDGVSPILPTIGLMLSFGFPIFGVIFVYKSSGKFLNRKSANAVEEERALAREEQQQRHQSTRNSLREAWVSRSHRHRKSWRLSRRRTTWTCRPPWSAESGSMPCTAFLGSAHLLPSACSSSLERTFGSGTSSAVTAPSRRLGLSLCCCWTWPC
jgi:ABC-type multidrug transport system ATPase subunit